MNLINLLMLKQKLNFFNYTSKCYKIWREFKYLNATVVYLVLIRAIIAVVVTIAQPVDRHAAAVGAREL